MKKINSLVVFDGKEAKTIEISEGELVKVQGVGSGTCTIKGKLFEDCEWDNICAIKTSDFSKGTTISDTGVWVADISGYSYITVEASGYTKVYMTILG